MKSLPGEANAVALIDLDKIRKAADGKSPEIQAIVERVDSVVPRGIRRMVMAASLDLDSLEPDWEAAVGELTAARSIEQMAAARDGYVDDIDGHSVAWSQRSYIWKMNPATVALLRPADRRMMAKWLRGDKELTVTPGLTETIGLPHDREALYLALDLTDSISRKAVRDKLEASELPNVKAGDFDRLAETIAGVRLISLSAEVDKGLRGRCRVEFSKETTLPADLLKSILLEVLDRRGASMADMSSWKARIEGPALVLSGNLGADGWDDIVSFLSGPDALAQQEKSLSLAQMSEKESEEKRAMLATKAYFDSVKQIVERVRDKSAKSQGERAVWNDRSARKIDELPLLRVDPAMVDYGTEVAALLRSSGVTIRQANLEVGASKARSTGGYSDYYSVNANAAQNAQIRAGARAQGTGNYLKILEEIDNETAAIRRAMTEKFNVEF